MKTATQPWHRLSWVVPAFKKKQHGKRATSCLHLIDITADVDNVTVSTVSAVKKADLKGDQITGLTSAAVITDEGGLIIFGGVLTTHMETGAHLPFETALLGVTNLL